MSIIRRGGQSLSLNTFSNYGLYQHKLYLNTLTLTTDSDGSSKSSNSYGCFKYNIGFPTSSLHQRQSLLCCNSQKCGGSVLIQSCSYHSLVNSTERRRRDKLLGLPTRDGEVLASPKRHLSFAWLDSLAVTQAGWFQALSKSQLVEVLMGGLQAFHNYTHLPWWASIILTTVLLRGMLTFPLVVFQQYIMAKVENLKPEMGELVKELKVETALAIKKFNWDEKHARMVYNTTAKKLWHDLILRENCHPFKATVLLWVQIPLWVSLSMSLRNMAAMMPHQDALAQVVFMELSTGGVAWIPNLTDVDHSLILPVLMGVTNLVITEVNAMSRVDTGSKLQSFATNLFRFVSVAIIPISSAVPSCVVLYWATSSTCALMQNLALMHPRVKRACGVPITPLEQPHPYQHLRDQFMKRLGRRKEQQEEEEMPCSQKEKEVKSELNKSRRVGGLTKR